MLRREDVEAEEHLEAEADHPHEAVPHPQTSPGEKPSSTSASTKTSASASNSLAGGKACPPRSRSISSPNPQFTVTGILKGYDQLLNLVLDDVQEEKQEPQPHTRPLGLAVLRGPTITILSPVDGSEEIENPFVQQG
ncbi:U6 snRNA-associated-like-Sm protein LSm7 [Ceratobasidium sp. AG-Ba]|nr:U6 snRNA-associated-like-Sm protein LSm7 [Ceratobasidium sp. AG-Ba]